MSGKRYVGHTKMKHLNMVMVEISEATLNDKAALAELRAEAQKSANELQTPVRWVRKGSGNYLTTFNPQAVAS